MTDQQKADYCLSLLEGMADKWSADVDLPSMVRAACSPMDLNSRAPKAVKQRFKSRMEAQIDAIVRQAFIEGAYRAITGLNDERRALERIGLSPDDLPDPEPVAWPPAAIA